MLNLLANKFSNAPHRSHQNNIHGSLLIITINFEVLPCTAGTKSQRYFVTLIALKMLWALIVIMIFSQNLTYVNSNLYDKKLITFLFYVGLRLRYFQDDILHEIFFIEDQITNSTIWKLNWIKLQRSFNQNTISFFYHSLHLK